MARARMSRVGVIRLRPPGVGIFRPVGGVPKSVSKHSFEGSGQLSSHHNVKPKPFIWTKSAADILQKVIRANGRLSPKQNATLH